MWKNDKKQVIFFHVSAHFHFTVAPDVICLFHLVTEQGGSMLSSPRPPRLDLTQNTHLHCLGLLECIWTSCSAFGNNHLFFFRGNYSPVRLSCVKQGWNEWYLCSSHLWIIDTCSACCLCWDGGGTCLLTSHRLVVWGIVEETEGKDKNEISLVQHCCTSVDFYCAQSPRLAH